MSKLLTVSVNGAEVNYSYDEDGMLTRVGGLGIDRNAANGLIEKVTLDQTTTSVSNNCYGERSVIDASFADQKLLDLSFDHDELGRIISRIETDAGVSRVSTYRYDQAGHLLEVKKGDQVNESYTYDSNGNRTSATRSDGNTLNAVYDAQDRLKSFGSHTYGYSKNGDLTSYTDNTTAETTSYDYDALGNLKSVALPDGKQIAYLIDPLDRRIGKKVNGSLVQSFLYGNNLGPVAELNPDSSIRSRFVYGTSTVTPDYMVKAGTTYRIVSDERGSPRIVVNGETGEIAQELDYDAYGRVTKDTNPGFQPFGFAGGLYDRDTGLVRFGVRDYDSETGRFTTTDPLSYGGGDTSLYGYVLGDPINFTDSTGLSWYGDTWNTVSGTASDAAGAWSSGAQDVAGGVSSAASSTWDTTTTGAQIWWTGVQLEIANPYPALALSGAGAACVLLGPESFGTACAAIGLAGTMMGVANTTYTKFNNDCESWEEFATTLGIQVVGSRIVSRPATNGLMRFLSTPAQRTMADRIVGPTFTLASYTGTHVKPQRHEQYQNGPFISPRN